MKKPVIVAAIGIFILIVTNLFVINDFYKKQISYQKDVLFNQADLCGTTIENVITRFESDLNSILFSDDISGLFSDDSENSQPLRKLELFYSAYSSLIKNIDIYDNNKNVYNLFKDKKFITDKYIAQRQRKLVDIEQVKIEKNDYQYYIPVYRENQVYGNIVVTVNLSAYFLSEMEKFHLKGVSYQWVIDPESGGYTTNFPGKKIVIEHYDEILKNLRNELGNITRHRIISDSLNSRMITVYKLVNVLDHKFGIAFSINNNFFIEKIFTRLIYLVIGSLLLVGILFYYLLIRLHRSEKKKLVAEKERNRIQDIFEHLPIGVIIFT
jgi:hypothetical protein